MTYMASIGIQDVGTYAKKRQGYILEETVNKDGSEGKPKKTFININLELTGVGSDELISVLEKIDPTKSIIKAVTLVGEVEPLKAPLPAKWLGRVFAYSSVGGGVIELRSVEGYPNLVELKGIAEKEPLVRFIGGNLLAVEGVPVGRFDGGSAKELCLLGKEEPLVAFGDGKYDYFTEVKLEELTEEFGSKIKFDDIGTGTVKKKAPKKPSGVSKSVKKAIKKATKESKPKPKKVNKKQVAFSKFVTEKVEF